MIDPLSIKSLGAALAHPNEPCEVNFTDYEGHCHRFYLNARQANFLAIKLLDIKDLMRRQDDEP